MKKILVFVCLIAAVNFAQAQNPKYIKAMAKGLENMANAQSIEDWQGVANHFERIATAEKSEWLPSYYQSFAYMNMAANSMTQQQMDNCNAYLDKSQEALDAAKGIAPEESEIYALQGFIYQGRIWEDPQAKGAQFSPLSHQVLDKAIALNPDNPRSYYLKGQNVFYTPAFFGGGAENARPILEMAQQAFEAYQATSPIHPNWGQEQNTYLLGQTVVKE